MASPTAAALALALALAPPVAPASRAVDDAAALAEIAAPDAPAEARGPALADAPAPARRPPPPRSAPPALRDEGAHVGCGQLVPACERLTIVGTIGGGLGVAAIAAATSLYLGPDRVIADEPAYLRTTHRAGATMLALGTAFALAGLLMVLTGSRAANKRRLKMLARVRPGGPT